MNRISFEYEPYQGQFFLTVNGYPVLLYEKDLREIASFVMGEGSSGQVSLCDWFRTHRPLFFKSVITECDRNGIVIGILRYLKKSRYFTESNSDGKNFLNIRSIP